MAPRVPPPAGGAGNGGGGGGGGGGAGVERRRPPRYRPLNRASGAGARPGSPSPRPAEGAGAEPRGARALAGRVPPVARPGPSGGGGLQPLSLPLPVNGQRSSPPYRRDRAGSAPPPPRAGQQCGDGARRYRSGLRGRCLFPQNAAGRDGLSPSSPPCLKSDRFIFLRSRRLISIGTINPLSRPVGFRQVF